MSKGGISRCLRRLDGQKAAPGNRCGKDGISYALINRYALTRNWRLINRCLAVHNTAINRDTLAGTHDHTLADAHLRDRRLNFTSVTHHLRAGRLQGDELLQCLPAAPRRQILQVISKAHEKDNQGRRCPLADRSRSNHADTHQCVAGYLFPECRLHHPFEDRVPANGDGCGRDPPWQALHKRVKQAELLAERCHNDNQRHNPKHTPPNERAYLTAGGRVCFDYFGSGVVRYAVAGLANGANNLLAPKLLRIIDHRCSFSRNQHLYALDAGKHFDCLFNLSRTTDAVHACYR